MRLQSGLASQACVICSRTGPHIQRDPAVGLMLCHCYLEIFHHFEQWNLCFHVTLGSANYVAGLGASDGGWDWKSQDSFIHKSRVLAGWLRGWDLSSSPHG